MKTLDARTRISIKNILYATDFSADAEAALPYALAIARRYNAKLYAAHVIAPAVPPLGLPEAMRMDFEKADREAQKNIEALKGRLRGVSHEAMVRYGDILSALAEIIEGNDVDLLVIGTHGRTGIRKLVMGSIAEELFRQVSCPVLTVGPHIPADASGNSEFHHIVYATDFSPQSHAAAAFAISLAQENQAQLSLLHVIQGPDDGNPWEQKENLVTSGRRLHELVPTEAELWCKPEILVEYGSPAEQILKVAKERHADLIVLGVCQTEGHVMASTHLPWATAHKVVCEARCPVVTVRG